MSNGHASAITDANLADVKEFASSGRAIPAVIVAAIIARLENAERALSAGA